MSQDLIAHGNKKRAPALPAKMKAAIAYLLDVADDEQKACDHAGLHMFLFKRYLRRTDVRRYLNDERDVRIAVARSGNVRALVKARDESENAMASVAAVKALEQLGEQSDEPGKSHVQSAGVTIQIVANDGVKVLPPVIDIEPEPPHHWPSVD